MSQPPLGQNIPSFQEIILEDLHTINNKPERLKTWMKVIRELTKDF